MDFHLSGAYLKVPKALWNGHTASYLFLGFGQSAWTVRIPVARYKIHLHRPVVSTNFLLRSSTNHRICTLYGLPSIIPSIHISSTRRCYRSCPPQSLMHAVKPTASVRPRTSHIFPPFAIVWPNHIFLSDVVVTKGPATASKRNSPHITQYSFYVMSSHKSETTTMNSNFLTPISSFVPMPYLCVCQVYSLCCFHVYHS